MTKGSEGASMMDEDAAPEDAAEPPSPQPDAGAAAADALAAGQAAGNIHLQGGEDGVATMEHAAASREATDRQARLIEQVEERRRLRATVVPTDVTAVKMLLRQLGQPITLFGEREVRLPRAFVNIICIEHGRGSSPV